MFILSLPLIIREQASSYPGLSGQMFFPAEMVHLGECHKVKARDEMTHGGHGGALARSLWCFSVPDIFGFPSFHLFWELLYVLSVTPFSP